MFQVRLGATVAAGDDQSLVVGISRHRCRFLVAAITEASLYGILFAFDCCLNDYGA